MNMYRLGWDGMVQPKIEDSIIKVPRKYQTWDGLVWYNQKLKTQLPKYQTTKKVPKTTKLLQYGHFEYLQHFNIGWYGMGQPKRS